MASSISKKASFRGSIRSTRRRRVRRAVSFTRDVFLLSAIRDESLDEINRVLLEMEADQELDLNAVLVGGRSALHQAVLGERDDVVRMFLDKGAYVDVLDDNGWTPLHYAVDAGQCDLATLLVTSGADPRHPTLDGNNCLPMDIAIDQCDSEMMALLSDGIQQAQHRPLVVVTSGERNSNNDKVGKLASPYDDDMSNETMDYESLYSDFDNRSIASSNSALFVPSLKRTTVVGTGPLTSLRRFRERYRRASPSPTPVKDADADVDTSEENYVTVNEFITDVFNTALRSARADNASLSSVNAGDYSQESLASFPNSSESPQSLYLDEGAANVIRPVRTSSPALDSKTSSSSVLSEESLHSPVSISSSLRRLSAMALLESACHFNSNGSLVSREQPAVATSSSSPHSSSLAITSSGSNSCSQTCPLSIPTRSVGARTRAEPTALSPECGSPTYDVPRSGVPRKFICHTRAKRSLTADVLGTSFDYDIPHSAMRQARRASAQVMSAVAQGDSRLETSALESTCIPDDSQQLDSSMASDARMRHLSRDSTLVGEESGAPAAEDHNQITPQASISVDSPELPEVDEAVFTEPAAQAEDTLQQPTTTTTGSRNLESYIQDSLRQSAPQSDSIDIEASDSTLGVRSSNSVSRLSPEFQLSCASKIKDSFTSVQSLPLFRHRTPDTSSSSHGLCSPITPDSTDSEGIAMQQQQQQQQCPTSPRSDYSSATLPWRGRHGTHRPPLMAAVCALQSPETDAGAASASASSASAVTVRRNPTAAANRLSAAEFLLSLSPSGPPAVVEEEVEEEEGEQVMSLLDFLESNDPPSRSETPSSATETDLNVSVEDFLLSTQSLTDVPFRQFAPAALAPEQSGAVVTRRTSESDDPVRAPRPVSHVSDWMTPVGSESLSSHVATLPRGSTVGDGNFKRNAAARGSLRRFITKATRSGKKSGSSSSTETAKGSSGSVNQTLDSAGRQASVGSDDVYVTAESSGADTPGSPKKSFMQRTSNLRNSFRSKKPRKLKSSPDTEAGPAAATGTKPQLLARDSASDVFDPSNSGASNMSHAQAQHQQSAVVAVHRRSADALTRDAHDKRQAALMTVAVTAL